MRLASRTSLNAKRSAQGTILLEWKAANDKRQSGVGFAIKTSIEKNLGTIQKGVNDRLMVLRIHLSAGKHATIISAYAPTMTNPDDIKESFYKDLDKTLRSVPRNDKLILLGDFNARVGRDHLT